MIDIPLLTAMKEGTLPVPTSANPIVELELTHLYVIPAGVPARTLPASGHHRSM
jgi:hypothetical protein